MKRCTKCSETKELAAFNKDPSAKGGFRPECKACRTAARNLRKAAHPERLITYNGEDIEKVCGLCFKSKHGDGQ